MHGTLLIVYSSRCFSTLLLARTILRGKMPLSHPHPTSDFPVSISLEVSSCLHRHSRLLSNSFAWSFLCVSTFSKCDSINSPFHPYNDTAI
ncbi:hypothetical protein V8E53_000511 [Lactarius tabidus]